MKQQLRQLLYQAIQARYPDTSIEVEQIQIQTTKAIEFGDFSSNVALKLAKPLGVLPNQLAHQLVAKLPTTEWINKVEVAGVGFINFHLQQQRQTQILEQILSAKKPCSVDAQSVHIEFVSANPTGPLHVGHGRGAAYGDSVRRILAAVGYQVHSEYYVNDAGRQIDILAVSVWLRWLQTNPLLRPLIAEHFPANGYQGDYLISLANDYRGTDPCAIDKQTLQASFLALKSIDDAEKRLDAYIACCKQHLAKQYLPFKAFVVNAMLTDIKADLAEFGIEYSHWLHEQSLIDDQRIEQTIDKLKELGHTYQKNQALWFKATQFGDDKDRVLIRSDGQKTYFASDVCYHYYKLSQNHHQVIDIWGADHHGYIKRVEAAMQALVGQAAQSLEFKLVQFVSLYRGFEKISMTTRGGRFVTLRQLREEIGNDAARFFYTMSKPEQPMNFDLKLAVEKSNDNPVFYVQYAHARIASIFQRLQQRGLKWQHQRQYDSLLTTQHELNLLKLLAQFNEKCTMAANQLAPQIINHYVRSLAATIHQYYNSATILVADEKLRNARLTLLYCCQQVLATGLDLLGVSAPEKM